MTGPDVKIGDTVDTDFGPGIVLDIRDADRRMDVKTADDRGWLDAVHCTTPTPNDPAGGAA